MEKTPAHHPLDRRQALAAGVELPIYTSGAALFADISGFTPLTESLALAYGPRRGADELTRQLNEVYNAIIAPVHAHGGAVIGFSGDAITCWFDDRGSVGAGLLAGCAAALAMQQAMTAFAQIAYPGGQIALAIKTALAGGSAHRFVVGDPNSRLIDVLAGRVLERMAAAEAAAEQGETLLDETSEGVIRGQVTGGWVQRNDSRFFRVRRLEGAAPPQSVAPEVILPDEIARPWLLLPVYQRIQGQQGRFLAELRPAAALFLKFDGLDFDVPVEPPHPSPPHSREGSGSTPPPQRGRLGGGEPLPFDANPAAASQLDRYIRWVQAVVDRFEGSLIQLTTGDKGSYLYVAFGAPVAHDDDIMRAISAALELANSARLFPFLASVRMGISQGRMRVGAYGSEHRRTYGVLGDETNLAARLMSKAEPGQILVSQRVAEQIDERFQLRTLGPMRFKGKNDPIPVFAVEGERALSGDDYRSLFASRLEGRDVEMAQMQSVLAEAVTGRGQLLRLQGEAGVGKSHLAALFLEEAQRQGAQVAVGTCQSTGRGVAYGAVGSIARQLLGLAGQDAARPQEQILQLEAALGGMNPEWLVRLPLLGDLLRLPIPDNPTTAAFTPQLRQEALTALALEIVLLRARQRPLLLFVEDLHWIDEASGQLILALARVIREARILLLLAHRPLPAETVGATLGELTTGSEHPVIELAELPPAGVAGLVSNRLGGPVDELALGLIQVQAQGNAFFTEELVDALFEARLLAQAGEQWTLAPTLLAQLQADGCVQRVEGRWQLLADAPLSAVSLGMPDSIHGVVLSRLDRLPEDAKLALKLASVIGRVFEVALLAAIHPAALTTDALLAQIETLSRRDFARLERPQPHITYIFKHNITQEVVYKTLLESQQQEVHTAVAGQLEKLAPNAIERLAFHYRHGDVSQPPVRDKALHYLDAAGVRARREYANETALGYVERALALESGWQRQQAKVELLHILGRREEEQASLDQLDGMAGVSPLEVHLLWGQFHEAMSDYPAALAAMETAAQTARSGNDSRGLIRVLGRTGLIHWRQGNYTESAAVYGEALELLAGGADWSAEEGEIRYGLGILHRQQGKFVEARQELEAALALARRLENRPEEAKILAALATVAHLYRRDYSAALAYNQHALEIRRTIGDRAGEGASLLALGQTYSGQGSYAEAIAAFQRALAVQQSLGNRWWEAIVWNMLGIGHMLIGNFQEAHSALTTALTIVKEIGAEVGEAYIQVNLGQILRDTGDMAGAEAAFAVGLNFAILRQDRQLEAICHSDLALLRMLQKEYGQAIEAAQQAQMLYSEIGTPYPATADITTLARASLALGRLTEAAAFADQALALLNECADEGVDFPHRDYWYCAEVLLAAGRPADAANAKSAARRLLQGKAEKISDPLLRASFLENVSFNREIWAAI
ncbi:MAG: tetratricopeptide repeat protein [Caldilineaceae bacterium]|nr:tetratricopeptide repeat protein [Caldilineaceae bacterium]